VRNGKDKTPFDVASANGKREVARFLLESAGDADSQHDIDATSQEQGSSQNTPTNAAMPSLGSTEPVDTPDLETVSLHIAAIEGKLDLIKSLLVDGANVNERGLSEESPLAWASITGRLEVAKVLIENGADGWSPLHLASGNAHVEVVQLLLERGADTEIRNSEGRTPADEALRVGQPEIAGLLSQYNAHKVGDYQPSYTLRIFNHTVVDTDDPMPLTHVWY
jgi:ankyrin repeat protein